MPLNFNPETHTYTDENGIIVDSVTKILRDEGYISFKGIHPEVLRAAQALGTNVHLTCELWDKCDLDVDSLSAPLVPYLDAWKLFVSDYKAEIVEIETVIHSRRFNFCGRLDRVLHIKGRGIWDIKTGTTVHPSAALQTAAYKIGYEEELATTLRERIKERGCVQLLPNGAYKVKQYKDRADEDLFKAIAIAHNGRKNYVKGEFNGIDSY